MLPSNPRVVGSIPTGPTCLTRAFPVVGARCDLGLGTKPLMSQSSTPKQPRGRTMRRGPEHVNGVRRDRAGADAEWGETPTAPGRSGVLARSRT
jgi:hypothetical protein